MSEKPENVGIPFGVPGYSKLHIFILLGYSDLLVL